MTDAETIGKLEQRLDAHERILNMLVHYLMPIAAVHFDGPMPFGGPVKHETLLSIVSALASGAEIEHEAGRTVFADELHSILETFP
jgi:hypothetical protein